MEKSLTLRGAGQLWPHKDWRKLLAWMEEGRIAAPWLITHTFPLSEGEFACRDSSPTPSPLSEGEFAGRAEQHNQPLAEPPPSCRYSRLKHHADDSDEHIMV